MKDVNYISHVLYQSKLLTASIKVPIFIEFIIFHSCVTIRNMHCVKSVQIQSYFWSAFSRIRTEYGEISYFSLFSPNAGKYGPEITLYLDTFHAVIALWFFLLLVLIRNKWLNSNCKFKKNCLWCRKGCFLLSITAIERISNRFAVWKMMLWKICKIFSGGRFSEGCTQGSPCSKLDFWKLFKIFMILFLRVTSDYFRKK